MGDNRTGEPLISLRIVPQDRILDNSGIWIFVSKKAIIDL